MNSQSLTVAAGVRKHLNVLKYTHAQPYLIDSQINASIRDDAKCVGHIAFVERTHSFFTQYLFGTVCHARILSCLPEGQTCLQHLGSNKEQSKNIERIKKAI